MKVTLEIPEYSNTSFQYAWTDGFDISIRYDNNVITLSANKEGLLSLANHLLNLAQDEVPKGCHIHLDEYNSLEEGSVELIIEKL